MHKYGREASVTEKRGGLGLTQGQRVPPGDAARCCRTAKCGRSSV